MPQENLQAMTYRVLRYTPNLIRDEWVNVGIILEDSGGTRREARKIAEGEEFARVRRLHPAADLELLRGLRAEVEGRVAAAGESAAAYLAKLDDTLSNVLQLSAAKGLLAEDFTAELARLYREQVAAPPRTSRAGTVASGIAWIRMRLADAFRRHKILSKMQGAVRVGEITGDGDPSRLDYAYRLNGTRGFVSGFSSGRGVAHAKELALTAERIRARLAAVEFTAVTETEPAGDQAGNQYAARLFAEQKISVVPLSRLEGFAESLRLRIH